MVIIYVIINQILIYYLRIVFTFSIIEILPNLFVLGLTVTTEAIITIFTQSMSAILSGIKYSYRN